MAVAGGASSSVFLSPAKETPALAVNPANVPALEIKLGALVVLLSVTLLFGFTPFCIVRGAGCFNVLNESHLISCFAGGVFFATCLLDLLPDYLQSISEAFSSAGITVRGCTRHPEHTLKLGECRRI
uniref:Uncharacterized protein n=1 Tax=Amphilophus citrinellus TaxID=61819 RepID=A0A3Q0R4W2_AMPCI